MRRYLLGFLHPDGGPIVARLLQIGLLLLGREQSPPLEDLLAPVGPVRELQLELRMLGVAVQHGRNRRQLVERFIEPHSLGHFLRRGRSRHRSHAVIDGSGNITGTSATTDGGTTTRSNDHLTRRGRNHSHNGPAADWKLLLLRRLTHRTHWAATSGSGNPLALHGRLRDLAGHRSRLKLWLLLLLLLLELLVGKYPWNDLLGDDLLLLLGLLMRR